MDKPNVGAQFIKAIYLQLWRTMNLLPQVLQGQRLRQHGPQLTLSDKPQQEPFSLPNNIYAFVP